MFGGVQGQFVDRDGPLLGYLGRDRYGIGVHRAFEARAVGDEPAKLAQKGVEIDAGRLGLGGQEAVHLSHGRQPFSGLDPGGAGAGVAHPGMLEDQEVRRQLQAVGQAMIELAPFVRWAWRMGRRRLPMDGGVHGIGPCWIHGASLRLRGPPLTGRPIRPPIGVEATSKLDLGVAFSHDLP